MESRRVNAPPLPLWLLPAVMGVTLLVYTATLREGIGFGDSGELVAAAVVLGVPHPPGYPVWTFLSHLWTRMPGAEPAWIIAFSSAVYMALAAGGIAWLLWRAVECTQVELPRFARVGLAGGGALLFAFSSEAWRAATQTEVYALHMLLTVAVWVRLVQWSRGFLPRLMAFAAGLALGLGLANHQTLLLAVPGYVGFVLLWEWRRALRPGTVGLFIVGALLGLSAYGALPLWSARDPLVDWSNTETWEGFKAHLTRQQYRSLGLRSDWGTVFAQFRFFGGWLVREYLGAAVLGAVAVAVTWRRSPRDARVWTLGHVLAFLGSGVLFTYIANTELDRSNRDVLSVYFMLPGLFVVLAGVPPLAHWLGDGSTGRAPRLAHAMGAIVSIVVLQMLITGPRVSRRGNPLGEHFVQHIVADLPEGAVVVAGTGVVHFGMLYAKATGDRPDLVAMSFNRLANPAYWEEVENQQARLVWPNEHDYSAAFNQVAAGAQAVYGAQRLAVVNGYLFGKLLRANPDRAIYYDEGIPVPWIYGSSEPHGMLLAMRRHPVPGARPEVAARDREFWDAIAKKLHGMPAYARDFQARQAFSRRRSTIGAWYAWHKDWANAEYALNQAIGLSVDNVDAYAKLAMVYLAQGEAVKGQATLQVALDRDPANRTLRRLLDKYDAGTAHWYGGASTP